MLKVAELLDTDGTKAGKPEDAVPKFVGGVTEDQTLEKGHSVRGHKHSGALPLHQLLPAEVGSESVSKVRQPRAVEETFKKRGHGRPPRGVEDHEVVAPLHVLLESHEIRFERLNLPVAEVEDGVKCELAQVHAAHFMPRFRRSALVLVRQSAIETVGVRMTE